MRGNELILYRGRGIGRRQSGDLHISSGLDRYLAGICDPGMLIHLRCIRNLDAQLIARTNEQALRSSQPSTA